MASKVVQICEEKICPVINKLGYEVIEVEYAKKTDGMNLSFFIDSPNGIFIEDCEKVNNAITDLLDEINPTNDESYILNVCSPGIDRPIKNEKDFLRNRDKPVQVSLYLPRDGKKKYEGKLKEFNNDIVVIEDDEGQLINFKRKSVALISPVIKF